jgi:hypothetical protein
MPTIISGDTGIDKIAAGAIEFADLPTGSVLQVISATKTDSFSSSSTSMVDITGLSVSITPKSATSKILVSYQVTGGCDTSVLQDIFVQLVRDSTAIGIGTTGGAANASGTVYTGGSSNGTQMTFSNSLNYLDSPATTSATTYKLQGKSWNASTTWYINRRGFNASFMFASSITVMEIAA